MKSFITEIKDIEICEDGARQYVLGRCNGIEIKCYNKDDAQWFKDYMKHNYPDIPLRITWLE